MRTTVLRRFLNIQHDEFIMYNIPANCIVQIISPVFCSLKKAGEIPCCPGETFWILLIL